MTRLFEKEIIVPKEKRIVFLGDSITDDGTYIAYIDAYFRQHWTDHHITLINLGVSSETTSGLSEPQHPFPRPCVHSRLIRALDESKPEWVVICYGMNDAIYHPFSEQRFQAYKDGIREVILKVKQYGAKAIVMTPPPFDTQSMIATGATLQPEQSGSFSWESPYVSYNEVLRHYANWLLSIGNEVDEIINIFEPLERFVEHLRKLEPHYVSGDGIHPNEMGHWVIAQTVIKQLFNIAMAKSYSEQEAEIFRLVSKRHRLLSAAWKEHVGHTNPGKTETFPLLEAIELGKAIELDIQALV